MWSAVFRMPLCPAAKIQPESRHNLTHCRHIVMMYHDVSWCRGRFWCLKRSSQEVACTWNGHSQEQCTARNLNSRPAVASVASNQSRKGHVSNSNTFFRPDAWFSNCVLIEMRKQTQANHTHSKSAKKHFDIKMSINKDTKNQGGICKDVFVPTLQYIAMFGMLDVLMELLISVE